MAGLTIYGNAQKYGAAAANKYGRIDPAIATAQALKARQTGLKITVTDSFPNQWELFAGTTLAIPASFAVPSSVTTSQSYHGYRLQMSMCVLSNGKIVRVRVGDGTLNDRNIYYQEITDPTVVSQWTSWTLLYSGTHYAVGVSPASSTTYNVYAAKSDGIYKNNALKRARTGVIEISCVQGRVDGLYVLVLSTHADKRRIVSVYYTDNIETTDFTADDNYNWIRTELSSYYDGTTQWRAQVAGFHTNARSVDLAESLMVGKTRGITQGDFLDPPWLIRGFAGQAGSNAIIQPYITKFSDGFFYLFYGESRFDASKDKAISTSTIFWQRSKDGQFWTEPIAIGFDNMPNTGFAVVEQGSYIWLANNGAVWRRPATTTQAYEISNYVPEINLEIPRDNQEGSGSFKVANPAGVNDAIKDFADKEVKVQLGIRVADGSYKYTEFNRWWIDEVNGDQAGRTNRLNIKLYDIWRRLSVPLRDTYNFIGKVDWLDFKVGSRNKLFNYYPRACSATTHKLSSTAVSCVVTKVTNSSFLLYTGWKGHNCTVSARYRSGTLPTKTRFGVIARYQDVSNYMWAYIYNGTLYLVKVVAGKQTSLGSYSVGTSLKSPVIELQLKWNYVTVRVNGVSRISGIVSDIFTKPGYAGVRANGTTSYSFDLFKLVSWEAPYTTNDLIRTALAMADFHDVVVAGGEDQQVAVVWGPQTDLNTPAAALLSLMKQHKLDLVWHNGIVHVGRFTGLGVVKTLQNEVIESGDQEKAGRRINLAVVDGQEDSYIEIDGADTRSRGRQIPAYFDLPELKNADSVRARAVEEVRKGVVSSSQSGTVVLQFDLWRMDGITWIDMNGTSSNQRIHGITIEAKQGRDPAQRMTLDMSPLQ